MKSELTAERPMLTLGAFSLPVTDYQLKTEMQVAKRVLCDGTPYHRLLGELPCTLTVSGTAVHRESGDILAKLEAAMREHETFDFTFAGMRFSSMRLTAVSGAVKLLAGTAAYTVTLTGVMAHECAL